MYIFKIFILFFTSSILYSNENANLRYGVFGEYGFDQSYANFNKLEGIPNCCPSFEGGSGNGISLGIIIRSKYSDLFGYGLRSGFSTYSGNMSSIELTQIITSSSIVEGRFEHNMLGNYSSFSFDPFIDYIPYENFKVFTGLRFAYSLSEEYKQKETIVGNIGSFVDPITKLPLGRVRNAFEGHIPNASTINIYGIMGLSYDLPLNKTQNYVLSPTISYYYNVNSLVDNSSWKINSVRIGVVISYTPSEITKEIKNIYNIDTITIQKDIPEIAFSIGAENIKKEVKLVNNVEITEYYYKRTDTLFIAKPIELNAEIYAVGVDSTGKEFKVAQFTFEEFISNRVQPLLPYVFFEENNSEIQSKYKLLQPNKTNNFLLNDLYESATLDIYYNILNIVGRRMTDNPNATLNIIGCNSGINDELNNIKLSKNRAEIIYKYFIEVWGINKSRLIISSQNLPNKPSTPINELDKIAENRRVELSSNNPEILAPIFLSDTIRTSNPPIARFYLKSKSDVGIKNWNLKAKQKKYNSKVFEQNGMSLVPNFVDWNISSEQKNFPRFNDEIYVDFVVNDVLNNSDFASTILPVNYISISKKRQEKIGDKIINRYNLILFDFNKSQIEGDNMKIIDLIKQNISTDSDVTITGYTDKTGDDSYNQKLSLQRAQATKYAISSAKSITKGVGSSVLLYDNNIPEGRFYCRTVNILVETPIK